MIRTALVEDNPADVLRVKQILERYTAEFHEQFQVAVYDRPELFLQQYRPFDLVLMDIELPGLNGMETARRMRKQDELATLIFITNLAQYAIHGYEVNALDFVLKPVSYYSFSMKLKRAVKTVHKLQDTDLNLNTASGYVRVAASEVLYVEVQKHYLTYHTETGAYTVRDTMKTAEEQLAPLHFVRCNNCYLVNLRHVRSVCDSDVRVGQTQLRISRPRRAEFLQQLTDYLGGNVK